MGYVKMALTGIAPVVVYNWIDGSDWAAEQTSKAATSASSTPGATNQPVAVMAAKWIGAIAAAVLVQKFMPG